MVDIFNSPVKQLIVPSEVPTQENRKLSYGVEAQPLPLDGFVAVDIGALSAYHAHESVSNINKNLGRTLSRNWKLGSQKTTTDGDGDINCTASATAGGVVAGEKQKLDTCAHVAVGNGEVVMSGHSNSYGHTDTGILAAAGQGQGGKVRRLNSTSRKSSHSQWKWINPRRVLFTFATVSSMGTLILLYFTLSMGKMAMDDPNIR